MIHDSIRLLVSKLALRDLILQLFPERTTTHQQILILWVSFK